MPKYYFRGPYEEKCFTLKAHEEYMKENGLTDLELFEAKPMHTKDFFFCSYFGEACGKGDDYYGCGNSCEGYNPRNGRSGRCRFHKNCYEPTGEIKVLMVK